MLAVALLFIAPPSHRVPATSSMTFGRVNSLRIAFIADSNREAWGPKGDHYGPLPGSSWNQDEPLGRRVKVRFALKPTREIPHVAFRVQSDPKIIESLECLVLDKTTPKSKLIEWFASFNKVFPQSLKLADISVGMAVGPWTEVGRFHFRSGRLMNSSTGYSLHHLVDMKFVDKPGLSEVQFQLDLPPKTAAKGVNFEAIALDGRPFHGTGWTSFHSGPKTYSFDGTIRNLKEIRLLACPYTWTTFEGVSLYPAVGRKRS